MGFDVSTTNITEGANQGARLALRDVHGGDLVADGKPCALRLAGKDSDAWRQVEDANTRRATEDLFRARGKYKGAPPEQQRADLMRCMVAVTLGWENMQYQGEEACSPEGVRALYEHRPDIYEQAIEYVMDRTNFLGKSKPS